MTRYNKYKDLINKEDLLLKLNLMNPYELENLELSKIIVSSTEKGDSLKLGYKNLIMWNLVGQKPIAIRAKRSVATFRITAGDLVGLKVTLRNDLMENFLDMLINRSFPELASLTSEFDGIQIKNSQKVLTYGLSSLTILSSIFSSSGKGAHIHFVFNKRKKYLKEIDRLILSAYQFPILKYESEKKNTL